MTSAPQAVTPSAGDAASPAALSARALSKRFGDVLAADALDLDFYRGEVHAVLGENGAGKSTLVKMLYGYYQPDSGAIFMDGRRVSFASPADARRHGIGMVFQNFTLVPALTVLENIALVEESRSLPYNRRALRAKILSLAAAYGLVVDPDAYVRDLSVGERQRVEILKLLTSTASFIILDEPTSVLAPHEVASLLELLRSLRSGGYTVILITHKLREVFAVADRVTVLRRGRCVGSGPISAFDERTLVQLMLGERSDGIDFLDLPAGEPGDVGIELIDVTVRGRDGRTVLNNIGLQVRAGEIVGIAAVAGNGQAELADVLLGTADLLHGSVRLGGKDVTHWGTAARLRTGLAVIPEDPLLQGAVSAMSVGENLVLTGGPVNGKRGLFLRPSRVAALAAARAARSPFPLPDMQRPLGTLSGGNAQRVIIARELREDCRYLVAYHPSRGLDVASTRAVQRMLAEARQRGCAVLLVSEDLEELQGLADRIVVIHHGQVAGSFQRNEFDALRIGHLMTGGETI